MTAASDTVFAAAPIVAAAAHLTMSSREIADLCDKRHDHVMRDIRTMLSELGEPAPTFGGSYIGENGKELPCFNLPKDLTLTLVAGYNVKLRKRIIDRWLELEAGPPIDPHRALNDPATMRGLLLTYSEKKRTGSTTSSRAPIEVPGCGSFLLRRPSASESWGPESPHSATAHSGCISPIRSRARSTAAAMESSGTGQTGTRNGSPATR